MGICEIATLMASGHHFQTSWADSRHLTDQLFKETALFGCARYISLVTALEWDKAAVLCTATT